MKLLPSRGAWRGSPGNLRKQDGGISQELVTSAKQDLWCWRNSDRFSLDGFICSRIPPSKFFSAYTPWLWSSLPDFAHFFSWRQRQFNKFSSFGDPQCKSQTHCFNDERGLEQAGNKNVLNERRVCPFAGNMRLWGKQRRAGGLFPTHWSTIFNG